MSRRLVVEADGGSRGNPGPAGFGALVRDAVTGQVLVEISEPIGIATNNVAEYEGLIAGLKAAIRIDPDCTVEVRMDSKLVVEQMSGRWSIKHEDMRRLAGEGREVMPASRVRYTWVPRANNAHADRLANAAMDAAAGSPRRRPPSSVRPPQPPEELSAERDPAADPAFLPVAAATGFTNRSDRRAQAADLGVPTTVILVRHGRTDYTDLRRACGGDSAGPELNAGGRRQAQLLAHALVDHVGRLLRDAQPRPETQMAGLAMAEPLGGQPVAVLSSPLLRARQTATVLGGALGLEPQIDADWAEVALGDWDGLSYAEIAEGWPAEYRAWRASTSAAPPHGESLDDVEKRVNAACDRLVQAHPGETVLVVSHTAPIRTVIARALQAGPAALWRLRVDPTAVSVIRFWVDGGCEVGCVNSVVRSG
jgi:ribonuclease H / adenosylcobalamin/alpha-ribazole phosphatase